MICIFFYYNPYLQVFNMSKGSAINQVILLQALHPGDKKGIMKRKIYFYFHELERLRPFVLRRRFSGEHAFRRKLAECAGVKIAICHYSCPPVIGGVETVVEQQARLLKKHHHYTKVVAGSGGKFTQHIDVDINPMLGPGIMDFYRYGSDHESLMNMEPQILSIMEFLEYSLSSYEVLIAHNILTMPHNLPLTHAIRRIAQRGKLKVISWNHDSPFFSMLPGQEYPASWEILKQVSPDIRYVSISQARKQEFIDLYQGFSDIEVVPNGISISNFLKLKDITNQLIEEKQLNEADLILLQPCRFHPEKNIEFSVRMVKSLLKKGVNAVLLLTATIDPHEPVSIEYHDRVKMAVAKERVGNHVVFISDYVYRQTSSPNIDRSLLRDLYNISDMLFLPGSREGYGITLLEAAVSRLPIVCSETALFKEMCDGNSCTFSLEEAPGEVADKVVSFASNGPSRMFKKVFKDYSWESIYQEQILRLLKNTLGAGKA